MKFKVGDYVKIKEELSIRNTKNFIKGMEKYRGKVAMITKINTDSYSLNVDNSIYYWNEYMVEPVHNKTYNVTVAGNTVIVTDNKGNKGVAKCSPEDEFDLATGISLAVERLRWKPRSGEYYWTIYFGTPGLARYYVWNNDSVDNKYFENGVIFKTKKEAVEVAKKMLEYEKLLDK